MTKPKRKSTSRRKAKDKRPRNRKGSFLAVGSISVDAAAKKLHPDYVRPGVGGVR